MNQSNQFIVASALGAFSLFKLFKALRGEKDGFKLKGGYENVFPLLHDILKDNVVYIVSLALTTGYNQPLYDFTNMQSFLSSLLGRVFITSVAYMVFYLLVEPLVNQNLNLQKMVM